MWRGVLSRFRPCVSVHQLVAYSPCPVSRTSARGVEYFVFQFLVRQLVHSIQSWSRFPYVRTWRGLLYIFGGRLWRAAIRQPVVPRTLPLAAARGAQQEYAFLRKSTSNRSREIQESCSLKKVVLFDFDGMSFPCFRLRTSNPLHSRVPWSSLVSSRRIEATTRSVDQ